MTELDPELRVALGLDSQDRLETLLDSSAPPTGVARGLSTMVSDAVAGFVVPQSSSFDELRHAIDNKRRFEPVRIPAAPTLAVWRWLGDPRVVAVDTEGCAVAASIRTAPHERLGLLLDGRAAKAGVVVQRAEGTFVISNIDGRVQVGRVVSPQLLRRLALDELLNGYETPLWFRQVAGDLLNSTAEYDHAAGAGLCARLAATLDSDPRATLGRLAQESETPASRVASWAVQLDSSVLQGLAQDVATELDAQHEALRAARMMAIESDPGGRDVLRALCEQRDDLESVLQVLCAAGRSDLVAVVRTLDRDATNAASTLALLGPLEPSARLAAVRSTDPDAWWGRSA